MNSSIDLFSIGGNLVQDYFLNKFIPGSDLGTRLLKKVSRSEINYFRKCSRRCNDVRKRKRK